MGKVPLPESRQEKEAGLWFQTRPNVLVLALSPEGHTQSLRQLLAIFESISRIIILDGSETISW